MERWCFRSVTTLTIAVALILGPCVSSLRAGASPEMTLDCFTTPPAVVFRNTAAKSVPLVVMITESLCASSGLFAISVGCGQPGPTSFSLPAKSAIRVEVGADELVCLAGPGSPAGNSFKFVLDVHDGR